MATLEQRLVAVIQAIAADIKSIMASVAVGNDGWSYVKLSSNALNSTVTSANTALAFTPVANKHYEIEGVLIMQAAATTTGVRPGISWPTGVTRCAAMVVSAISQTAQVSRFWGAATAGNTASTGVFAANEDLYGQVKATLITGASPSGRFTITLASEVAASEARLMAGSFIRYRLIP